LKVLILREVSKSFGIKNVIVGLTLNLNKGDFLLVKGPSGSGKTTLLKIMSGLLPPDTGSVEYGTLNIYSSPKNRSIYLRFVGYSFQEPALIPYLNVLDNLIAPLIPLLSREELEEKRDEALSLLREVGLQDRIFRYPNELSTGERKKVDILRAFLKDPEVIFLDEPYANLDASSAEKLDELIKKHVLRGDRIGVISTHIPSRLEGKASRIIEFPLYLQ